MTAGTPLRRRAVFVGAGACALAAGVGSYLLTQRDAGDADAASGTVWRLRLPTPQGGTLRLDDFRGKHLLLNFWAPWCAPCVEELPLLDRFHRENAAKGWHVIGIAVDQAAPVESFLSRVPVAFPVGLAGFQGIELSKSLGNPSGGLPFTVLLSPSGAIGERKIGRIAPQDLQFWLGNG